MRGGDGRVSDSCLTVITEGPGRSVCGRRCELTGWRLQAWRRECAGSEPQLGGD